MIRTVSTLFALVMLATSSMSWADHPIPTTSCFRAPASLAALAASDDSSGVKEAAVPGAPGDSTASTGSSAAAPARVVSRYAPPDSTLITRLTQGGYVLVFRHGKTDWAQRDAALVDFAKRSDQRNLSEEGRKEATAIGAAITALHIPVGAVLSSPMWRCRDTATLAFGHADTTIQLFQRGRQSREARLRMLSTPPSVGTNTVLVTHQDVLLPIMKLKRDELGEGEALIVRPLGGGNFEVLAQVAAADWIRFIHSRKL